MLSRSIRLVTFDALHTLITPREPIHVQYARIFAPYVGQLDPGRVKNSFKIALKAVQQEQTSYSRGVDSFWTDVVRRTAIGAGADAKVLDGSLQNIVEELMRTFSSKAGYRAFEDAIPTVRQLRDLGMQIAVISNGDSRLRNVLRDLDFPPGALEPIVLSEEEGVEKPSADIFKLTLARVNAGCLEGPILASECLHVGDELRCDYDGALGAGMQALLIRRRGVDGEQEQKDADETLGGVNVVHDLGEVIGAIRSE